MNNAIKTLANYYDVKYNTSPRYELLQKYVRSVSSGRMSPLSGFDLYEKYHARIEEEIVGKTTVNGIGIAGQTNHFLERVFGTASDPKTGRPRNGVSLEEVKDALFNGIADKPVAREDGEISVRFLGKTCSVTMNPNTGKLIQTNPRRDHND